MGHLSMTSSPVTFSTRPDNRGALISQGRHDSRLGAVMIPGIVTGLGGGLWFLKEVARISRRRP